MPVVQVQAVILAGEISVSDIKIEIAVAVDVDPGSASAFIGIGDHGVRGVGNFCECLPVKKDGKQEERHRNHAAGEFVQYRGTL